MDMVVEAVGKGYLEAMSCLMLVLGSPPAAGEVRFGLMTNNYLVSPRCELDCWNVGFPNSNLLSPKLNMRVVALLVV
jgi:hypothetical protein